MTGPDLCAVLDDFSVSDQQAAVRASLSTLGSDAGPEIVTLPSGRQGE